MIAAIQALFRPRPNDKSTRAAVMKAGAALGDALRAREALLQFEGRTMELARTRVLHRALERIAADHGPALGADPVAFSGGGPKSE
jgi:hypothetical protein